MKPLTRILFNPFELSRNTYIFGGSVLLGILGVTFFVRRARAKGAEKKVIEAPAAAPPPLVAPPVVEAKRGPQRQPSYRAKARPSFDLPKFKTGDFTIPKPPRLQRRGAGTPPGRKPAPAPKAPSIQQRKAWLEAQAEFEKHLAIQNMTPQQRAQARRDKLIAEGIKPGSVVPGPINLPPPWACPNGYGWIHNQKKFPHGRWSCKQGVVTQRPKPGKTGEEARTVEAARKAAAALAQAVRV